MMATSEPNKYMQFLNLLNIKNFFVSVHKSVLSPCLNSLCIVTDQKDGLLYSLPGSETAIEPIWQCPSKIQRCIFSEDGKSILVVLRVNSFQIYTLTENNVGLLLTLKASELTTLFHDCGIDYSAACKVKPLLLKKQKIVLMMDKRWIVSIEWSVLKAPIIGYSIPVELHQDVSLSGKFIFVLNNVGLINIYNVMTGELVSNELSARWVPFGSRLFKLKVHHSLPLVAAVNELEETVLLEISDMLDDKLNMKKASADGKRDKWSWSYKTGKSQTGSGGLSLMKILGKVVSPLGLVVFHLQFSIRGLFVFYGILGQSKCNGFKVIDESTGGVLYNFDGLVESKVISGGPLPLVCTDSILSVCLGVLCNDYFVTKLCKVVSDVGFSSESEQILTTQYWPGPFDFHLVFLKIILRLHVNLFRNNLKKSEDNKSNHLTGCGISQSKIIEKVCELFRIVVETKEDPANSETKDRMLVDCFLHAVRLLDVARLEPRGVLDGGLFSGLLRQVLTLFESVRSVDPLKDDWVNWLELADGEVVREACTTGALGLAHVFLVANRGWPANEVEGRFRTEAHAWIAELVTVKNLEKAEIVLQNMGEAPIRYFKWLAIHTNDEMVRDVLMDHLNELAECSAEALCAWDFGKKFTSVLSSGTKRYYVFDQRANLSARERFKAVAFKIPAYRGSIDLDTLLTCSHEWRDEVSTELYFSTGDIGIEKNLNKSFCWKYLIKTNHIDYLKNWIELSENPRLLDSFSKSSDYFEKNLYNRLAGWPVTENMLNDVIDGHCMTSTKTFILDASAFHGLFATSEKHSLKKLVFRLENSSLISNVRTILSKPTSSVTPNDLDHMIFTKCMDPSMKPILLMCLEKPISLTSNPDSLWLETWKSFWCWSEASEKKKYFRDVVVKCSSLYDCESAFESSLMDVAIALLDNTEISEVIESQGTNCSLLRFSAANFGSKAIDGDVNRKPDVSLYDLLNSSKIAVTDLYLWQSQNKHGTPPPSHVDAFIEFPHFNHQVLATKYGFRQNLDHLYYLKQGRPSFACNLFVVESLRTQRRLTTKMIKRVCGLAHGLALRRWKDRCVGNGCVAFLAMLGDIAGANILRIHLGALHCARNYLPENVSHYMSTLARGIGAKDLPYLQEMASILESSVMTSAGLTTKVASLEKWYLAVSFCNIHGLPLPSSLLKNLARNHDWFSFMTCMDIFKYPYEQAIELIEEISSKVLKSHLIRAVTRTTLKLSTTSPSKSPPKILLEPESIGKEDHAEMVSVKDVFHSFVTNIYTEVLNTIQTFTDKNIVLPWSCEQDPDSDLLLTLLKCESEADTSKSLLVSSLELQSPVLAVFATCFQCDNIFPNLMAWLISSIPTSMTRMRRREEGQELVDKIYGSKEIETLLVNFFSTGYFQTFFRGMSLFMPENPITLFLNSVYHGVFVLDFDTARELLKGFTLELAHFSTKESAAVFSKTWILNVVGQCIENLLTRPDVENTIKRRFLRILADSDLSSVDSSFPNYLLWSQICEILECSQANLDFVQLYDLTTVSEELQNCLDVLIKNSQFSQALEICSLLSVNKDQIVLAMWKKQFDSCIAANEMAEKIWKDSCSAFKDENVNPNSAASFYYDMAINYPSSSFYGLKNRYFALKYCLYWRRFIQDTLSSSFKEESDAIELDMWKCCIHPDFDLSLVKNEDPMDGAQKFHMGIWTGAKVLIRSHVVDGEEKQRVENLINVFLDEGDLPKALRLSAFFKSENEDLMLITSCLKMIYEKQVGTLDVAQKKVWLRLGPGPDFPEDEITSFKDQHRVLLLLEKLCQTVNRGKSLARRLFICYRLSVNLDLSFKEIISETDYLSILPKSVSQPGVDKFRVASDLIALADLSPLDLAKYLKDRIVSAIVEFHSTDAGVSVNLWDVPLDSDFHLIMSLVNNPSFLGSELLQASSNLSCGHGVEVLVRAHDCFTACCNVEGIGRVLRRARILASVALQAAQWQYLVRLLIGIERYADMSYIFQMLKDNGQFEQLLRKGMHRVPGLHVAISEFLKRYCPQDRELGKMVAAHFGLHSKLAGFWQEEADEIISRLPVVDNILKDTGKTRQQLTLAMENYSHAVHWFLQAGKLNRALKMGHRAQIVAMQISLLGGPFILRVRSPADMQILLNGSLSVEQILVVSRAYDFEPDWISALHERWILKGDKTFLADLKSHSILSSRLISNYLNRHDQDAIANGKAKDRVKQLCINSSQTPSPLTEDFKIKQILFNRY